MSNGGIYEIRNLLNNKIYIGSAVNLIKRKANHFSDLRLNKHRNTHLQNSFNKYGKENFKFKVLINCFAEDLIKLEQDFINFLNPKYNICRIAGSQLGLKRSVESKERMRKAQSGKKQSDEHIINRSKARQISVIQLTKNNEFIKEFDSAKQASEILGISAGCCITMCCKYSAGLKSNNKTAKGFKWMYKEQYINGNYIELKKK